MLIMTSAAFLNVVAVPDDPGSVLVCTRDRDSLQGLIDGVEMVHGSGARIVTEGLGGWQHGAIVSRGALAAWLAFEVGYVTYPDLGAAVASSRGDRWRVALGQIRLASLRLTGLGGGDKDEPETP